jgi:hypothetical protein
LWVEQRSSFFSYSQDQFNSLESKMGFPPKVYQFLVGTFAALGSSLYGYDLTIVAEGKPASAPSPYLFAGTHEPVFLGISGIKWLIHEILQPNNH